MRKVEKRIGLVGFSSFGYLRLISLTKIQMSQSPPVTPIITMSNRKCMAPYLRFLLIVELLSLSL